ncbi:MAG TPA: PH domain-containing protein [Anaerolineaceae bacterium]
MNTFHPPLRRGLITHLIIIGILLAASGGCLWAGLGVSAQGNEERTNLQFVAFLLASLLFFAPLPWVFYRLYALLQASYTLERDGLRIHWGLRSEDIPLPEIEWVRPASDLTFDLPVPLFSWYGALRGTINVEGLGPVEFLGAEMNQLLLVATPRKIYAISPANPKDFLKAFRRVFELGSLTPFSSFSAAPSAFLLRVWSDKNARWLFLAGLGLALFLAGGVLGFSLLVPNAQVVLTPSARVLEPVPANRLLLLPVLGGFLFIVDLAVGTFFYRRLDQRPLAYLLWGGNLVTLTLLIAAAIAAIR